MAKDKIIVKEDPEWRIVYDTDWGLVLARILGALAVVVWGWILFKMFTSDCKCQ
jgi:hypothetical protein